MPLPATPGYSRPPIPTPAVETIEVYSYNNSSGANIRATISNQVVEEAIYEDEETFDEQPFHKPATAPAPAPARAPPPVVPRASDIEEIIYAEEDELVEHLPPQPAPPPLVPRGAPQQHAEPIYGEDDDDETPRAFAVQHSAPAVQAKPMTSYESNNMFTNPRAASSDFKFDSDITGFGEFDDDEPAPAPAPALSKPHIAIGKSPLIYEDDDDA